MTIEPTKINEKIHVQFNEQLQTRRYEMSGICMRIAVAIVLLILEDIALFVVAVTDRWR
jgi:hypothetical protein